MANIIVIGLGSMGKRRIRLLKQYDEGMKIVGVDKREDRCEEAHNLYKIDTFCTISESIAKLTVDAAFICTAPLSHSAIICECLKRGLHVFTELNLNSDGYEENIKLALEKNLKLFLSSTFLYREEIAYIDKRIAQTHSRVNYTYHAGQYLPDWHPWESYEDFFVGDKRTNGCREFFAIELPWIQKVFGEIENIQVRKSKNTELNIAFHDNYMILIDHRNGTKGALAVDVISRKPVRNLEVYSEELYISWNGSPQGLYEYDIELKEDRRIELYDTLDQRSEYSAFILENAYLKEIEAFFKFILDGEEPMYDFAKDLKTIEWMDRIEA